MKRIIYFALIIAGIAIMGWFVNDILFQVNQHVATAHPSDSKISAFFSALFIKLILMMAFFVTVIVAMVVLLLNSSRKAQASKQIENVNNELMEKQYTLEEQNALIEELNSQLEDENFKYYQQKEILHAIIDSFGAGIMMTDSDGAVLFINKAWKDIFSYLEFGNRFYPQDAFYINGVTLSSTERIMQSMMSGIENSEEILNKLNSLLTDNRSRYDVDLEQTNPVKRFLNLYSNPCVSPNNNSFGRVFVVRDVSHQKEVDRLKLELVSTVSHELRTPMSSIM